MGRVRNREQVPHRPGPLVQTNKKHKTGKHRSKGLLDAESRGRVSSGSSTGKRRRQHVKRSERRKQAIANRDKKIQEMIEKKGSMGGVRGAPISIALIPLSSASNPEFTLNFMLRQAGDQARVAGKTECTTYVKLKNGKNLTFVRPRTNDFWSVLDTLKLTDIALFLLPILEPLSEEGRTLLKCAKDQGLPTPFVAVSSIFSKVIDLTDHLTDLNTDEKAFLKSIGKLLPVDKIYPLVNPGQVSNFLRIVSGTKITIPRQFQMRAGMLIETSHSVYLSASELKEAVPDYEDPLGAGAAFLRVTGHVRRRHLNPHSLVHISGGATFRIMRIDVEPVEGVEGLAKGHSEIMIDSVPSCPPRFLYNPALCPPDQPEAEDFEDTGTVSMGSDDDGMDQELFSGDDDDDDQSQGTGDMEIEKKSRRVPKGTSEYQADWLPDSDESEDGGKDLIESDEELQSEPDDASSQGEPEEEDEMDWVEEQKQLQVAKAARTEAEFPDWIDTPLDIEAKVRFQRYRGLQSFKTSPWDPNENLPRDYSKIVQFQNYRHTFKKVLKEVHEDGLGYIPVGQRVTMLLKPVDAGLGEVGPIVGQSPFISLFSLLPHENKMSVLNLHLNLSEALKNKETLIFQVGFQRFQAKPILSEVSTGNKHKMLRYGLENMSCMATVYGPIVFPVASVLTFKPSKSSLLHVGSGSVFSIDPTRIVVKRVLLSGYPFKTHGKKATVRFMFFNRGDIEWFKPVELRTRYGRRGHIRSPLGTHGHMKCSFDGELKSQDTVLMPLYKRVFPKWNYDTIVPSYSVYD